MDAITESAFYESGAKRQSKQQHTQQYLPVKWRRANENESGEWGL
jgi:hypothetical protein